MNFLFWNTQRNSNINAYLELLMQSKDFDVIALAEYADDALQLMRRVGEHGLSYFYVQRTNCPRIELLVKFNPALVETLLDTSYYTIKKIPHPSLGFLVVAFVHLPSQLHTTETERISTGFRFREDLEEVEEQVRIYNTIVVGDFNVNPFEPVMLNADAFHSVPTRQIANQKTRVVEGRTRKMFYNPMWNFFGDRDKPAGTYYYRNSGYECLFWNLFDQVIVRPELIDHLDISSIQIFTKASGQDLLDRNGYPNKSKISDHLPLSFTIR